MKIDFDLDAPQAPEAPKATTSNSGKTKFDVFEIHIGSNSFRDASGNAASTAQLLSEWESVGSRFVFGTKRKLGGAKSPLVFQSGIAFETLGYSFTGNNTLVKVSPSSAGADATTEIQSVTDVADVRRNRFDQTFLEVPVMLHLDFSPKGKVDKSIALGVGAFAGVRLSSQNLLAGSDSEGQRIEIRTLNNYNTELLRYGLQAQLGYKSFKLTGRLDGRPFFQEGAFQEEVYVGSLSLGVAF